MDDVSKEIKELEQLETLEGIGALNTAQRRRLKFLKQRRNQNMLGFDWPLWDSVQIATASTTELQFFQEPIGQSSKTKLDTNMSAAGLITTGDFYDIAAIGIRLKDSVATQIPPDEFREILYTGYFELWISDRLCFSALIDDLPWGGGAFGNGSAAAAVEYSVNGSPSIRAMHFLKKKIRIPRNTHFIGKCHWPTAPTPTTAIKMVVKFEGMLWRRRV